METKERVFIEHIVQHFRNTQFVVVSRMNMGSQCTTNDIWCERCGKHIKTIYEEYKEKDLKCQKNR